MKRKLFFLSVLFLLLIMLVSCMGSPAVNNQQNQNQQNPPGENNPPEDENEPEKVYYKVMVAESEGFSVKGENPIEIEKGGTAVFEIEIEESYAFLSTSIGSYDQKTGKLTVKNVTKRITVDFKVEKLSYDTEEEFVYLFYGTAKDTTSVMSASTLKAGTLINVSAGDMTRNFDGWSFGKPKSAGGAIVSREREYEFRLNADIVTGDALFVYPNYSDANIFYYDLQGGVLNLSTVNMTDNEYYTARVDTDGRVKITLLEKYFKYAGCASTFWDDGSFTKNGYILKEYNTKPDGSGEAYSLGSKYFPLSESDGGATLYCIWEKAAAESAFKVDDITIQCPSSEKNAPDWIENGIIITEYLSDSEKVVIPETINGKKVIAIASGAFKNKSLKALILPRTIEKIEDGAFVSCSSLETVYFPDSVYSVSDKIFDTDTYSSFKNLILNATMAPRYTKDQYGAFAVKFCRVLSAGDEKMIIFVAGSSTYQGLGTEYLEALLDGEYRVVNYGTTRTRPGYLYMEALAHYTDENDIVIFAPENSAFMLGENLINKDMLLQLEGVNNLFRYIDFSKYTGYFTGIANLNAERYAKTPQRYESICDVKSVNKYGDYLSADREQREPIKTYKNTYYITFNERIKSLKEGPWSDEKFQAEHKDYTDLSDETWTSLNRPELLSIINSAMDKVKATGARVYFSFAPVDANAIVDEAKDKEHIKKYDELISKSYHLDGLLGSSLDYIYNHNYFYDCAYHVNDFGRTYRTYGLYLDLAKELGIEKTKGIYDVGKSFEGCMFEDGSDGSPLLPVDFLK